MKLNVMLTQRKIKYRILSGLLMLSLIIPGRLWAAESGSVSKRGAYQADGSYKWTFVYKIPTAGGQAFTIHFLTATDFPFKIINASALKATNNQEAEGSFEVLIPAAYITEPVRTQSYGFTLQLKKENQILVTQPLTVSGPLPTHPRLLVRADEIPGLKKRFKSADFDDVRKVYEEQKSFPTDGKVEGNRPDERIRQKMEALAFDYLMNGDSKKKSATEAIRLAINYLTSYADQRTEKATAYEDNTNTYEAIMGAALVYDWCYPLLTDDNKQALVSAMKRVCLLGEYGLPGTGKSQYLSGHYGECAPTIYLAMGIAMFDEDPSFFDFELDEQIHKFAPSRNPMYAAGTHHQGAQYIHVRYTNELLQHFILNKLGLSPYVSSITNAVYRAIYGTLPQKKDMDGMPEGDGHNHLEMGYSQLFYLAANLTKDPVLQSVSKQYLMETKHQSTRLFLYHRPEIESKPVDSLCLSRFFPSPSGIMIARTKWDFDRVDYSSDAMVVLMNMKEYNAQNHTHLDAGHFGIYYKGHLALDAGIYQGKDAQNGWAKLNYTNYFARTVAHNSLLILDPNEPLPSGWDKKQQVKAHDGGQFFLASHAWETSAEMFKAGKSAEILATDISCGKQPDYTYFKGDLTNAYKVPSFIANYPAKVQQVRRSFVFLNHKKGDIPGSLIVLDKVVSSKPEFKKTWLLHTQNEPEITNNQIVAVNKNNGRNGQLLTTVILPEANNRKVDKIGGSGKEYWCDGQNWGSVTQEDAGCWRIELSPDKPALADNFLNVVQAMNAGTKVSSDGIATSYSVDREYVVLVIKDRIVAQGLNLDANSKTIKFNAGNSQKSYQLLITDLSVGKWMLKNAGTTQQFKVSAAAGTIYATVSGGDFQLTKTE